MSFQSEFAPGDPSESLPLLLYFLQPQVTFSCVLPLLLTLIVSVKGLTCTEQICRIGKVMDKGKKWWFYILHFNNLAILQFGNFTIGNRMIWRFCSLAVLQFGNLTICQFYGWAMWQFGNLAIFWYGTVAIWQFGNLAILQLGKNKNLMQQGPRLVIFPPILSKNSTNSKISIFIRFQAKKNRNYGYATVSV